MAFKSVSEFNDTRYHGMFRLINDQEYADVIFLYQSMKDMLVAQAHYVKSANYSGYVHCCEKGCPACSKGIRVQTKLFVPVFNIDAGEIQFWDRSMKFEPQLEKDVFGRFPNPSEFIFRITRHGIPNDINTTYSIEPIAKNTVGSYDTILSKFNAKMPDYYSEIIRDVSSSELAQMLQNSGSDAGAGLPEYTPIPRAGYQSSIPETFVSAETATATEDQVIEHYTSPNTGDTAPAPNEDFIDDDDGDLPVAPF